MVSHIRTSAPCRPCSSFLSILVSAPLDSFPWLVRSRPLPLSLGHRSSHPVVLVMLRECSGQRACQLAECGSAAACVCTVGAGGSLEGCLLAHPASSSSKPWQASCPRAFGFVQINHTQSYAVCCGTQQGSTLFAPALMSLTFEGQLFPAGAAESPLHVSTYHSMAYNLPSASCTPPRLQCRSSRSGLRKPSSLLQS